MEYVCSLKEHIYNFTSVLNINYDSHSNLYNEFIFKIPESEINNPICIFLKSFLIKYSEKFKNSNNKNFIFYFSFFVIILEQLDKYEKSNNQICSRVIIQVKEKLLRPFFKKSEGAAEKNRTVLQLQTKLENELFSNYIHLFLPNEVSLLSILIITSILESEDISNPNLFIRTIHSFSDTSTKTNHFIICIDSNIKIIKIINYLKNQNNPNISNIFIFALLSDDLHQTLNQKQNLEILNSFLLFLIKNKINVVFSNKKINDKVIKTLLENMIIIIDKINLKEYQYLNNIFQLNIITNDIFFNDQKENESYFNSHISNNPNINLEIIQKDEKNIFIGLKDIGSPNKCSTILIRKFVGIIDEERRTSITNIIKEYTDLVISILDKEYKIPNSITYDEFLSYLINAKEENINETSINENKVIENILVELDKLLFYKFNSVKEEFTSKDLSEIRNKIIISQDLLIEVLEFTNLLLNN